MWLDERGVGDDLRSASAGCREDARMQGRDVEADCSTNDYLNVSTSQEAGLRRLHSPNINPLAFLQPNV